MNYSVQYVIYALHYANIPLNMKESKPLPKICVVVRKRPLGKKELQKNDSDILETQGPQTIIAKEVKYSFIYLP